jgi:hypothetical protein
VVVEYRVWMQRVVSRRTSQGLDWCHVLGGIHLHGIGKVYWSSLSLFREYTPWHSMAQDRTHAVVASSELYVLFKSIQSTTCKSKALLPTHNLFVKIIITINPSSLTVISISNRIQAATMRLLRVPSRRK